jgi:dGTPase
MDKMQKLVEDIYGAMFEKPKLLSTKWQKRYEEEFDGTDTSKARVIADYIASMTDRFAIKEHARLFNPYQEPL